MSADLGKRVGRKNLMTNRAGATSKKKAVIVLSSAAFMAA